MGKVVWKPGTFVYPIPAVLVTCGDMEKANIITVAWTRDNKHRPSDGIYISKTREILI